MARLGQNALLVVITTLIGALLMWLPDGISFSLHEIDTFHLVDILGRLSLGQTIHQDFTTPIGILMFAPFAPFTGGSMGMGEAILSGFILFSVVAAPFLFWIAQTRLSFATAALFVISVQVMLFAMVVGPTPNLAISMHYNRWAWAVAFCVLAAIMLPLRNRRYDLADGIILGLMMAFLALGKVTYFLGLFPAVLIALIWAGRWKALFAGLLAGLVMSGAVSLLAGSPSLIADYARDLLAVSRSPARPYATATFYDVVVKPDAFIGSLLLLTAPIQLYATGKAREAVVLAAAAPGLIWITYQNFGNDQLWLLPLAVILLQIALVLNGRDVETQQRRRVLKIYALVALIVIAPTAVNMARSTVNHAITPIADYTPAFTKPALADIRITRLKQPWGKAEVYIPGGSPAEWADPTGPTASEFQSFGGVNLPFCELMTGYPAALQEAGEALDKLGVARDRPVFVADIVSVMWLFSDTVPVPDSAPWYYGDAKGFAAADFPDGAALPCITTASAHRA